MIKLLNGEEWPKEELVTNMMEDDFYYGFLDAYKVLSSSSLKELLKSPKAFEKYRNKAQESSQALRDGRLIHMSILEKHKLNDLVIVEGTKARKDFKEAVAEHGDHMVYTSSELESAYWVADAIERNNEASFLLSDCNYEVPEIGYFENYDVAFRAKADALTKDGTVIIDLKTTSSPVSEFKWSAKKYNYALQAALYKWLFNADQFIFLVVEKGSKDIGIFECSDQFLEDGANDIRRALDIYKEYIDRPNYKELLSNYVIRDIL
jgi:hypothetical protein